MQTRQKLEIHTVRPVPSEKKPEARGVCSKCGGPAEVETFWSTSPDRPGWRVLKRQTWCGQRPRRCDRAKISQFCPIVVEEIGLEPIPAVSHWLGQTQQTKVNAIESGNCQAMSGAENGRAKSTRGRLPVEVREQILEMHAQDVPLEQIAEETSRSLNAVRKVVESLDNPQDRGEEEADLGDFDLDEVIEFLCTLPDEAVAEVVQLARLNREKKVLRSSLEVRLRDLRRPD